MSLPNLPDIQDIWRADPVSFAVHLTRDEPDQLKYLRAPHLSILGRALARAALGIGPKRIGVFMPPRHGKSELVSKWFPLWCLDHNPHWRVILASYEASFASSWGGHVRTLADTHAADLSFQRPNKGGAEAWGTGVGPGGMNTAGVGGPITGKGAHVLIIDDPVKNAEEAASATYRAKAWDWYRSTAYTRLEPGGTVVLVMTRWHHQDLAGTIKESLEDPENPDPEPWVFIDMPAVADDENDALKRKPGEALWPQRYPPERLQQIRAAVGPWVWSSLYQQKPSPEEGEIFQKSWFRYYRKSKDGHTIFFTDKDGNERSLPFSDLRKFQTVDVATSTRQTADFFVIGTWAVGPEKELFLLDIVRDRIPGPRQLSALRESWMRWKVPVIGIERTAYQLSLIQNAVADGLPAVPLEVDGDKVSRAQLAGARYYAGAVYHPTDAAWLPDFELELLQFPKGAHDDQVDVLSAAAFGVATGTLLKRKLGKMSALRNNKTLSKKSNWGGYHG